jgi:hypothetical protein
MSHCLGNLEPYVPDGPTLGERAEFGMAPGELGGGVRGGKENLTKALVAPHSVEKRHGLHEAVDGPTIVTLSLVDIAERLVRQRVQDGIPTSRGECQGTLGGGNGLVMCTPEEELAYQKA